MKSEDKPQKFQRLAKLRGERVLKDIQLLGNLSNRNNYEYSDQDVKKLFMLLESELKFTKSRFVSKKKREIRF